jgi:hypothetical protein
MMIHCHDVTKLNDVARRQYISGALAAVLWPIFAGYRICFQQQCRSLKVTGKFIVTPPILNRFSTFLHHVVQNRKICNFCAGRQSVTAENFEIGCFVYGIRIRHATNTEFLDFPIFVFNLTLNLDFMVTFF